MMVEVSLLTMNLLHFFCLLKERGISKISWIHEVSTISPTVWKENHINASWCCGYHCSEFQKTSHSIMKSIQDYMLRNYRRSTMDKDARARKISRENYTRLFKVFNVPIEFWRGKYGSWPVYGSDMYYYTKRKTTYLLFTGLYCGREFENVKEYDLEDYVLFSWLFAKLLSVFISDESSLLSKCLNKKVFLEYMWKPWVLGIPLSSTDVGGAEELSARRKIWTNHWEQSQWLRYYETCTSLWSNFYVNDG